MSNPAPYQADTTSPKLLLAAVLLCFFLGTIGVHRFYVGKIGTGVLMILTLGGLGVWTLIDLVMLIVGAFRDKEGRKLTQWT
ncbi:TM2 domain-containing protein [Oerskovia sp. KBS0722]|uniref:TM2 domain-containing protein n=1 Tax=Oerskovia sp. KBS0722 TaxID=1179673 RepID=UPI00110E8922|nr:TM2 domain-containing protein [Oerskovia sp. KBS0722]QDW63958.1 TM2 domain-containing protein [Oerskovia sp. KBS0722]